MKLFTKICISALVHMIWFFVIYKAIYEAVGMMSHEPIYGVLLSGEFMFVVYPVVANLIVYLVYKIRPLETKKEKRIFICTTTIFSLMLWLPWVLPGF